jgi:zinc protease
MLKQLGRAGAEAPDAEEMSRSKGSTINPFVFKFSTPHRLVSERALEEFYGYKEGYLDSYVADISGISAEAARAAGKKYFDPGKAVIFVIGDSAKFDKPLSEFGPVTELKED